MRKINKNMSPDSKNNVKILESGLRNAFTLVELIVVITILAILGTIAFMSFQGYSRDARDSIRTVDLGNMKTSLELYSLKTGNFPKPDNFSTITYSGGAVWYQGIVGDQVTTNLKSLNEKPLDPLTNDPYTYSVTQSKGEYEILALYEGNVAQVSSPIRRGLGGGLIPYANAATTTLTPKVVGNYNGVYIKTPNYIIPTPSIITSEPLTPGIGTLLTSSNIQSQIITNGINIPKNSLTLAQTGALNINLSVYTGSITKFSLTGAIITAMQQIQGAYTGTTLATNNNIAYILNQTTNDQLIALSNIIVSPKAKSLVTVVVNDIAAPIGGTLTIPATTSTQNINLIITCPIDGAGSIPIEMFISGTGLASGGNIWETCTSTKIVTVTSGVGAKAITIKWRDSMLNETSIISRSTDLLIPFVINSIIFNGANTYFQDGFDWYKVSVSNWSNIRISDFMSSCESINKKLVNNYGTGNGRRYFSGVGTVSSQYCTSTWGCTLKSSSITGRLAFASNVTSDGGPGLLYGIAYGDIGTSITSYLTTTSCYGTGNRTCYSSEINKIIPNIYIPNRNIVYIPCK